MSTKEEIEHRVVWYRGTIFSAFMVAATAFTCPGIFGALNGMGAGGGASPGVSNAANAIVFAVIAVGSLFVGAICNQITPKWTLVVRIVVSTSPNSITKLSLSAANSLMYRLGHWAMHLTLLVSTSLIATRLTGYSYSAP